MWLKVFLGNQHVMKVRIKIAKKYSVHMKTITDVE